MDITIITRREWAVVLCESERGRVWMRNNFLGKVPFIARELVEDFVRDLENEGLEVNVV